MLRRAAVLAAAAAVTVAGTALAAPAVADPASVGTTTVVSATAPAPAVFYVSCKSGTAAGDGSSSRPWTSLAKVTSHGAFRPGERVLLKRGTTCKGSVTVHGSGTASAPIVLGAYGSGAKPTIAGGGTKSGTGAVQLVNVAYWSVQDLHITNTTGVWNTKVARAGLLFRSTNSVRQFGLVAQRLTVDKVDSNPGLPASNRRYGGIVAQTSSRGTGFGGMLIKSNAVNGVGRTGIGVFNTAYPRSSDHDVHITGNRLTWIRGDSIITSGVDVGRVDHNVSAHGSNISKCSVKQCGRMGGPTTANAAIWPTMSSLIRIDHNEVYGEHKAAGDGSGIDIDLGAHKITVEQNYLHDNERGGVMFCGARDTTVRFNVLQNNGESALWFTCGWQKDQRPTNITITNNDIVSRSTAPWVVRNIHPFAGKNIRFTNNLVFCKKGCTYSWPNKPIAASNTYVGKHSKTEPKGTGTRHASSGLLRAAGTGRTGFASLKGYRVKKASIVGTGVALSGSIADIFDKPVNTKKPGRGASGS